MAPKKRRQGHAAEPGAGSPASTSTGSVVSEQSRADWSSVVAVGTVRTTPPPRPHAHGWSHSRRPRRSSQDPPPSPPTRVPAIGRRQIRSRCATGRPGPSQPHRTGCQTSHALRHPPQRHQKHVIPRAADAGPAFPLTRVTRWGRIASKESSTCSRRPGFEPAFAEQPGIICPALQRNRRLTAFVKVY